MAYFTYTSKSSIDLKDLVTGLGTMDVYGIDDVVKDVSIGIKGFTHTYAPDLDMLLVGPDGQHNLAFMSDVGGGTDLTGVDFSFSDAAANPLANISADGEYLPTDAEMPKETASDWGLAIPTINHGGSSTFASAFGGIGGNGQWSLYVDDDAQGDVGSIDAWTLTIHTDSGFAKLEGDDHDNTIDILSSNFDGDNGVFRIDERGTVAFENAGSFFIYAEAGNDLIRGDREKDYIYAGTGRDTVYAGGGSDYIVINANENASGEIYDGGVGKDILLHNELGTLNLRADTLKGVEVLQLHLGGKIQVLANQLTDVTEVYGSFLGNNPDVFEVTMGKSKGIHLDAIAFTGFDNPGDKVVVKGDGNAEFIVGSDVNDVIKSAGGNDTIITGDGLDTVDGGGGSDTIDYSDRSLAVKIKLNGSHNTSVKVNGVVEDTIKNVENATGGFAADTLKGDKFANSFDSGMGADTVTGGAGHDKFVFKTMIDAADHIKDFSHVDDTIVLDNDIFTAFAKLGAIKAKAFHANDVGHDAHTAKQKLIYDKADHSLWYDADGNGAGAAIEIAVFDNKIKNLDFHDFQIV